AAEVPRDFRPALEDMVPKLKLATGDFYYRDARADRAAARLRNSCRMGSPEAG
ncbi:alpha/beta hydrolase family protein, partial [Listeria monocytogenes]|nr:alpha/beta hydrolase family protein [Listeria monocytogenes]